LSMGLIIYYGAALAAIVAHIFVNGQAVNLWSAVTGLFTGVSPIIIIGGAIGGLYLLSKNGVKVPFLT